MGEVWVSPRQVEEDIKQYVRDRFERLMQDAGDDEEKRKLAFVALRAEMDVESIREEKEEGDTSERTDGSAGTATEHGAEGPSEGYDPVAADGDEETTTS